MEQDFKVNTEEKMNQKVSVSNQSVIKVTKDVIFINRYRSNVWGGQESTYTAMLIGLEILYMVGSFLYYISTMDETPQWLYLMLFTSLGIIPFVIWIIIMENRPTHLFQ